VGPACAYYVDAAWAVRAVPLAHPQTQPHAVLAHVAPGPGDLALAAREHPSLLWASPSLLVVANGAGTVLVLRAGADHRAAATHVDVHDTAMGVAARWAVGAPETLLAAGLVDAGPSHNDSNDNDNDSDNDMRRLAVVMVAAEEDQAAEAEAGGARRPAVRFRVSLRRGPAGEATWTLTTAEPPVAAHLHPNGDVTLAGTAAFALSAPVPAPRADPMAVDHAPVPLTTTTTSATTAAATPAYSWVQTESDVTVQVVLPDVVDKRGISVQFARSAVRVAVRVGARTVPVPFDQVELLGEYV
jgi:hypothetical protein